MVVVLVRELCRPFVKCFCGALEEGGQDSLYQRAPGSARNVPRDLLTHVRIHHPTDTPSRPHNHDPTCPTLS